MRKFRHYQFERLLLTFITLFAIAIPSKGIPQLPEQDLSWKNIAVDGKKIAVFCMMTDKQGIMWLGTNSGIFFYDGTACHQIGGKEMSGTQIYAIVEKGDSLLLGSNNGLLVYEYASGRISSSDKYTPKEIRTLLLNGNDLWIGSLDGIFCLNLADNKITNKSKGLPHKSVYSIFRDSRGIIYAGTYRGIARWNPTINSFASLKIRINDTDISQIFANCIIESEDSEHIYVGGEGILLKFTPSVNLWEKVSFMESNNVKSLAKGKSGHILIGTDNGMFDMSKDTVKHYRHDSRQELSLADNEIWCIYADKQNNIWTGHERGFSIASDSNSIRTIKLSTLAHSGEGNEIHSIYRDSHHNIWLAGTNGIIKLSGENNARWYRHSSHPHSLSHNRVRDILEDDAQNIWFATDAGINRYNPNQDNFTTYHVTDSNGSHNANWVYAIVEDKDNFWIGSFLNGLHLVKKSKFMDDGGIIISEKSLNTETILPGNFRMKNDLINDMVEDRSGNLWILLFRDNALVRYSPSDNSISQFDIYELTKGYPTNISCDNSRRIWCAFKGGVIIFDNRENHRIVKFPSTNSDETVLAMSNVGNGMWVSTQSNVWEIDGKTLEPRLLPIPQKSFTAIYEDSVGGKVLLGGTDEIIEVDRKNLAKSTDFKSIKMILNDSGTGKFNLSDISKVPAEISIPYGGGITLVVGTIYSPESVQRFMYKLADSPTDMTEGWIVMPEGSNTITLSDLKMGHYHILVKTIGSPNAPISIPLKVEPPLWWSWWAILLYIVIGIITIYWIIRHIKNKNLRSFQAQQRQTALKNVEKKLTFLSSISHDLKTPLSMILGPVSIMKEQAKDPESKRNLEAIYENAVRLNNMIHRTIELQHIEDSNENLLILSIFDVVEFCKSVFEVFKENNPQKTFIFHSCCNQILIETDAVKFESVITNLLSNACKYSDNGSTISIGISKTGNNVEIAVSDDGVGISDSDQPLIFQRMFRAPATAKLKEGTGLGLYLIKQYLEMMHGNIDLYSKEKQGTTFVVSLPVSEKTLPDIPIQNPTEISGKPKILIVEDNLQISGFISSLINEKYTILTSENGRSGLAIASSFMPDLIIADEMMPIMSGLEMVKRLKQNPRLSSIPIIMLTAKSDNLTENESIKLGIDVFMTKPFEPYALLGRISQLLKARTEIKEKIRIQTITEAETKPIEAESVNERSLAKIARIIEENISDPDLNVNTLSEKSGIPTKQLYRLIKKYLDISPLDYIRSVRLQKAAVLLSQHRFTVSEVSYMVGFKTPSYFAKCFQNQYGVKPSQYQSDDETINKI